MSVSCTIERHAHVAVLTLNRPEQRNPISDHEMVDALTRALAELDRDTAVRVIVLTGAGPAFSTGGNLKEIGKPGELGGGAPVETRNGYRHGIQRIPRALHSLDVPVIAAVNGAAVGAGCDLALFCDVRIAARSASFAESFVRIGIVPGDGGAWILPRLIGQARAAELMLTGRKVSSEEALKIGLVSEVVEDEELMSRALALADEIASNPPHAVRMTKKLMLQSFDTGLDQSLELASALQALAHTTQDHKEAVLAFMEKRAPEFSGL